MYIDANGKAKHGDFPALSNWLRRCDSLADARAAWKKDVSAERFLRRPMLAEESTRSVPFQARTAYWESQKKWVRYDTSPIFYAEFAGEVPYLTAL